MNKHLRWTPVLICIAVTLSFSLNFYYRAPYHDHWDLVTHYQRLQTGAYAWGDLFVLHGSHWHASGLFVKLVLAKLTGMAHWTESVASMAFAGLGFLALARILLRVFEQSGADSLRATIWLFGIAAFFFFSLDQAGNWLWGWQVSVFINLAGVLWAIERLSSGSPSCVNALLASIAAAIAIYAFATGWAVIPIGFGLLIVNGAHRTWQGKGALLIWTTSSALILLHYAIARSAATAAGLDTGFPTQMDFAALIGFVHYTINFLASPLVRFARDISIPIIIVGLGVSAWSIWRLRQFEGVHFWQRIAPVLALAAYSGGAAFLTAVGRWEAYGVKQAFVSRYISFGTLFWIAVFALVILAIVKLGTRSHRVLISLLGLFLVLKLGNIPSVVKKSLRISADIQATSEVLAVRFPEVTPADYAVLHAPGQEIAPHLVILHNHRASFFAATPETDVEVPRD
jgi:hypothetical protein